MKIVVDARTMGSKPSGIGMYTFYYIKELIKSEHEIILLTDVESSQEMQYVQNHDVKVISFGTNVYRSVQVLKYFDFVRKQLQIIQPDLFWEPNILIPRKLLGYKGKIMITIHDMFPLTHARYFEWKYVLYFGRVLKKTIQVADIILYDSYETKEIAEKFYQSLKNKATLVQYVIVPRVTKKQTGKERISLGDIDKKNYFLYVGNMEKRKGVDLLLDAYDKYREKGGEKTLLLAGKSRENDVDKKIAYLTGKYSDVTYLGYVSDANKQQLYQQCACFIFPSMAEGFGICVLEAMNYYKPIIASNLSIFKEIVGENICYFSLGGDRWMQVESLCQKMLTFDMNIDREEYDKVLNCYLPEKLSKKLLMFLKEYFA